MFFVMANEPQSESAIEKKNLQLQNTHFMCNDDIMNSETVLKTFYFVRFNVQSALNTYYYNTGTN